VLLGGRKVNKGFWFSWICYDENKVELQNHFTEVYIQYNLKNNIFELTSGQYVLFTY